MSHGLKRLQAQSGYFLLPKADLYVDCRVIPEKGIQGGSGTDKGFQSNIKEKASLTLASILTTIQEGLSLIPDRRSDRPDPLADPVVVCFVCAWGVHRSVATKKLIGDRLRALGFEVTYEKED